MRSLYEIMGCMDRLEELSDFLQNGSLSSWGSQSKEEFDQKKASSNHGTMLDEFDRFDRFIFEFVPFTELGEQRDQKKEPEIEAQVVKDRALFADLQALSSSCRFIYCDEIREHIYKE